MAHTQTPTHEPLCRIVYWSLIGILITPLLAAPGWFMFPYIVPKAWAFRILVEIIVAAALVLVMSKRLTWTRLTPLQWTTIAFAAAAALSAVVGVDAHQSWWSNHERMLGVFSLIHYATLVIVVPMFVRLHRETNVCAHHLSWKTVWWIVEIVSVIVATIAIMQYAGSPIFNGMQGGRSFATLGNPIYMGNMMAITLFVSALLWGTERSASRRRWLIGAALLQLAALLISGSRGALFGLAAGIIAVALVAAYRRAIPRITSHAILALAILFVVIAAAIAKYPSSIARLTDVTSGIEPRLIAWNIAIDAWKEKPLFGWGYGNFFIAFNKHFNPRSTEYSLNETWFDNAHNQFLNTLTETGIIGLLAYLAIYLAAARAICRMLRDEKHPSAAIYPLIGALATEFAAKIAVFDNHTSLLLIMLLLGYIVSLERSAHAMHSPERPQRIHPIMRLGIPALMAVLAIKANIQPALASNTALKIIETLHKQPQSIAEHIESITRLPTPHATDIRMALVARIKRLIPSLKSNLTNEQFSRIIQSSFDALEQMRIAHPQEIRIYVEQALLASLIYTTPEGHAFIDERFEQAIALSPARQEMRYIWARVLVARGEHQRALEQTEIALQLNPNLGSAYWMRGWAKSFTSSPNEETVQDIYTATVRKRYIPQTMPEMEATAIAFTQSDIPVSLYDRAIIAAYERQQKTPPAHAYLRLIETYNKLGLFAMAHETQATARALFPARPEFQVSKTSPKQTATSRHLRDIVAAYRGNNKPLPAEIYESLMFALAHEDKPEDARSIIADIKMRPLEGESANTEHYECIVRETSRSKPSRIPYELCGGENIPYIPL